MDFYDNNHEPRDVFEEGPKPGFTGFGKGKKAGVKKPHQPMSPRSKGVWKVVALCLVCALIGAFVQPLMGLTRGSSTTLYSGSRTPTKVNTVSVDTSKEMTTAEIYNAYSNSCVGITVDLVSTNIFGQTVTGAAAGSGFVISADGYILTNYHVIENANSIKVAFVDGATYDAKYIGGDKDNDIAVVKIDATGLTPVVIGSSNNMLVGEQVTTIGNPLGELTFSESTGIISALNRTITMSDGRQMDMIQTDCAINSGNSGGPLFNSHGEVIGIVSAKYSSGSYAASTASVEGLGFAIPIDNVADMVNDLVTNGYISGKPLLGISVETVADAAKQYGVPAGAKVDAVVPGLCADKAGIQVGDIITKVGDTDVTNSNELINAKNTHKAGDVVDFTLYRSGKTMTVSVALDENTKENAEKQDTYMQQQSQQSAQSGQDQQDQQNQQDQSGSWPFGSFNFGY